MRGTLLSFALLLSNPLPCGSAVQVPEFLVNITAVGGSTLTLGLKRSGARSLEMSLLAQSNEVLEPVENRDMCVRLVHKSRDTQVRGPWSQVLQTAASLVTTVNESEAKSRLLLLDHDGCEVWTPSELDSPPTEDSDTSLIVGLSPHSAFRTAPVRIVVDMGHGVQRIVSTTLRGCATEVPKAPTGGTHALSLGSSGDPGDLCRRCVYNAQDAPRTGPLHKHITLSVNRTWTSCTEFVGTHLIVLSLGLNLWSCM